MIGYTAQEIPEDRLTIVQINTNKSDDCMHDFLHGDWTGASVITIQEPYIDFLGRTRALPHHHVIYPFRHRDEFNTKTSHSVILVNTRLSTGNWTQLNIDSPDAMALQLTGTFGTIRIFNIYLDGNNDDTTLSIQQWLLTPEAKHVPTEPLNNIWVGDFNRHHPKWDDPRNHHLFTTANLEAAQRLINNDLHMTLPKLIPTLKVFTTGNHTRVDNIFCTRNLVDRVIVCNTLPSHKPIKTDHFPIQTTLEIRVVTSEPKL